MSKISEALQPKSKDCVFVKIYLQLEVEDRNVIGKALASKRSGYAISQALRADGHKVASSSVSQHIKERCSCYV